MTPFLTLVAITVLAIVPAEQSRSVDNHHRATASKSAPGVAVSMSATESSPTHVITFPGGSVTVAQADGQERVRITDSNGQLHAESFCPAESGTFDQLRAFFIDFKAAVTSGNSHKVAELVGYPLRVNGAQKKDIKNRAEMLRRYSQVFAAPVLKEIRAAEPAAVFCRDGQAMIGNGAVWVSAEKGRVSVSVVNVSR
jgi:hypothetical protein